MGQPIHLLAPEVPYRIQITLEAADDLDTALEAHGPDQVEKFTTDLERAMERIAVLPHLGRVHHDRLRVTALANCPYRLWYILDETTRTALLVGVIAVTHSSPPRGLIPGPWKKKWWLHQPRLPALLPDPYPEDSWAANPDWKEEDDQWWLSRIQPRAI